MSVDVCFCGVRNVKRCVGEILLLIPPGVLVAEAHVGKIFSVIGENESTSKFQREGGEEDKWIQVEERYRVNGTPSRRVLSFCCNRGNDSLIEVHTSSAAMTYCG